MAMWRTRRCGRPPGVVRPHELEILRTWSFLPKHICADCGKGYPIFKRDPAVTLHLPWLPGDVLDFTQDPGVTLHLPWLPGDVLNIIQGSPPSEVPTSLSIFTPGGFKKIRETV